MRDDGSILALAAVAIVAGAGLVRRRGSSAEDPVHRWRALVKPCFHVGDVDHPESWIHFETENADESWARIFAKEQVDGLSPEEIEMRFGELGVPWEIEVDQIEYLGQKRRSLRDLEAR